MNGDDENGISGVTEGYPDTSACCHGAGVEYTMSGKAIMMPFASAFCYGVVSSRQQLPERRVERSFDQV
jgi:hypothetical protein